MSEFLCPRCHGPYFGVDDAAQLVECHCDRKGRSMSVMPGDPPSDPACGWRGHPQECGLGERVDEYLATVERLIANPEILRIQTSAEEPGDPVETIEIEVASCVLPGHDVPTLMDLRTLHIDSSGIQISITHLSAETLDQMADFFGKRADAIRSDRAARN